MDEKQEIQSLRRELEQANYEYYVLDNPSMSDYDFDHKLRRLEELEAKFPELVTPIHLLSGWAARWPTAFPRFITVCLWRAFRTCSPLKN